MNDKRKPLRIFLAVFAAHENRPARRIDLNLFDSVLIKTHEDFLAEKKILIGRNKPVVFYYVTALFLAEKTAFEFVHFK